VGDEWQFDEQRSWEDPGYAQGDDEPVTCVNWHDASAYAAWLGERTGRHYRLPSESEWEYAARAGTTTAYWFGDDATDICRYVNLADQDARERFHWDEQRWEHGGLAGWRPVPCHDGHATMAPVEAFPPNPFGLYGMLGNANEWVADCWVEDYANGPADERARLDTGDCGVRVLRGESWVAIAPSVRSAFRIRVNATDRRFAFGIRVARDVDAAEAAGTQPRKR
jgi:formylglycine-generating enzyme required for sulfatase activity